MKAVVLKEIVFFESNVPVLVEFLTDSFPRASDKKEDSMFFRPSGRVETESKGDQVLLGDVPESKQAGKKYAWPKLVHQLSFAQHFGRSAQPACCSERVLMSQETVSITISKGTSGKRSWRIPSSGSSMGRSLPPHKFQEIVPHP